MTTPTPFVFLLICLAAFRTTRIVGWDTVTDVWRRRLTGLGDWGGGELPPDYRRGLDSFLHCPYCLGFWISLVWFAFYEIDPTSATIVAWPLAVSAAIGIIAKQFDP